jgi:hypothetical protein
LLLHAGLFFAPRTNTSASRARDPANGSYSPIHAAPLAPTAMPLDGIVIFL